MWAPAGNWSTKLKGVINEMCRMRQWRKNEQTKERGGDARAISRVRKK